MTGSAAAFTCPEGHPSTAGDYCDVCGAPIEQGAAPGGALDLDAPAAGTAAVPPPLPTLPVPAGKNCPNCSTVNVTDALYCENCGYDFTTGQVPRPLDPPAGVTAVPGTVVPPVTPASAPGHVEWVAEVWVDPDWYATQDSADPCPSPGMPLVVPIIERSVLIGRASKSRNIHPQIDLSADSGVSRRHAQLTSDGTRWWVEDLQSANGTYIGGVGTAVPATPIAAGRRTELADDDRIYLGAWTRIVIRQATPEETTLTP